MSESLRDVIHSLTESAQVDPIPSNQKNALINALTAMKVKGKKPQLVSTNFTYQNEEAWLCDFIIRAHGFEWHFITTVAVTGRNKMMVRMEERWSGVVGKPGSFTNTGMIVRGQGKKFQDALRGAIARLERRLSNQL
jgi:hypothetical protein